MRNEYIKTGKSAESDILKGVQLMYDAVCQTLSPKGRNAAIKRPWGYPIVINDGVTIAREVKSPDRFVQMGIDIIKEAAQKTNDEAGDGTTTSILLAYELITRGIKLKIKGVNPMVLRDELRLSMNEALEKLKELSRPVESKDDLIKIASVSSSDKELGKLIGEVVFEMGDDGLVTVEESGGYDTWIDKTDGMSINKGYASPYFVTDSFRLESVVNKPVIIITDKELTTNKEIVPVIEFIINKGKKNIVIVGEVSGAALQTLVTNKMNGVINCVVIKPPGFGDNRAGYLEDIAIMTGGSVISKELGMEMDEFMKTFNDDYLGGASKVVSDASTTMFVKGHGKVKRQVEILKELLKNTKTLPDKEIVEERIAKLTTGVAVVRVGAKTEVEAREKIERVKDAVGASQAAFSEGYVSGSGVTFLKMASAVRGDSNGSKLLRDVLEQPIRKVLENCGEKFINPMVETMRNGDRGYEAVSGEIKDLIKEGIIDPVKVIRLCVENSVSVASSLITTEVLIDYEERQDN